MSREEYSMSEVSSSSEEKKETLTPEEMGSETESEEEVEEVKEEIKPETIEKEEATKDNDDKQEDKQEDEKKDKEEPKPTITISSVKNSLIELQQKLDNKEIDNFEYYLSREETLRKLKDIHDEKLFISLFINDELNVSFDDNVIAFCDIDRYDIEKFQKNMKMKGLSDTLADIKQFGSAAFTKIKEIITKILTELKPVVEELIKEFVNSASTALKDFIKEYGKKAIKYIISQIINGTPVNSVMVKSRKDDEEEVKLCDVLNKKNITKFEKLAEKVKEKYINAYNEIQNEIERIKAQSKGCCCVIM